MHNYGEAGIHGAIAATAIGTTFSNGATAEEMWGDYRHGGDTAPLASIMYNIGFLTVAPDDPSAEGAVAALLAEPRLNVRLLDGSMALGAAEYGGVWVLATARGGGLFWEPAPREGTHRMERDGTALADRMDLGTWAGTLRGADGGDDLASGTGGGELFGGPGSDNLVGRAGRDLLVGGRDPDLVRGEGGNDTLRGGGGDDTLSAGAGRDHTLGKAGDDLIDGGTGRDALLGGGGGDTVIGGPGGDRMNGGRGDDELDGGNGSDRLKAGAGEDTLEGGRGDDVLFGGEGGDVFAFDVTRTSTGDDIVRDFDPAEDTLSFTGLDRSDLSAREIARGVLITFDENSVLLADRTPQPGDVELMFA